MAPFYNTIKCQAMYKTGEPCRNMAYYSIHKLNKIKFVCGVHSQKIERIVLPKDPDAKFKLDKLLNERQLLVEKVAKNNKQLGKKGDVICTKLKMMKQPEHIDGYLKVFPNFKHGNRKDGYGCPSLSPKSLGPINHGQPSLPISLNLENFHQGNKVFKCEVDERGEPLPIFFDSQIKMYKDKVPHRYKFDKQNIPLYSVWRRNDGKLVKYTYFESRQFYCTYYERMVPKLSAFKKLKKMVDNGYNLQIIGYDAYPITKDMETLYKDISRPFGHELVLYTLLTEEKENYPWRKYKTEKF